MKPARNEKPHSARSVGSGSLTSGQQAEFVLTFLRKSAGNEFVSGAQPLAIPLERKAPGLDHRDPACARQILCRGDARLVGQGEEEIVLDLEMNRAREIGRAERRERGGPYGYVQCVAV